MYNTYIIYSLQHRKTYVGISEDIQRRIEEHNSKKSKYTSRYAPWVLVFYEEYSTREEARKREKYFKSGIGREWMKNNINWPHSSTCLAGKAGWIEYQIHV
jgi:putative endonuclease